MRAKNDKKKRLTDPTLDLTLSLVVTSFLAIFLMVILTSPGMFSAALPESTLRSRGTISLTKEEGVEAVAEEEEEDPRAVVPNPMNPGLEPPSSWALRALLEG